MRALEGQLILRSLVIIGDKLPEKMWVNGAQPIAKYCENIFTDILRGVEVPWDFPKIFSEFMYPKHPHIPPKFRDDRQRIR